MPSLDYLNPPPHPFWDFVAGMEDHPFFGAFGRPPHYASREDVNPAQDAPRQAEDNQAAAESSEKAKGKQPTVEDPPEVDPTTVQPNTTKPEESRQFPFRGHGRFGQAREDGEQGCRRGQGGCGGRGGRRGGPPPFMFGPGGHHGPWWARREGGPPHGPPHGFPHGPPPPGPPPGPFHGPPHGPHEHHHGRRGGRPHSPPHFRGGRHAGPGGFNLGEFLNNLGERLGVDLAGAAENLGVDKYSAPRNNPESDFEPRADIFDTPTHYTIHLSLPGAKKEDVGVDWDGEHSVLRIAGVVHRPGVDEHMLSQLVVNGRKRENGVFEKAIRLGTKLDPASIDVAAITAKMTDGVLVVKVPKVEVQHHTREVPISSSGSPSPPRDAEKNLLFDADEDMYDAESHEPATATATPAVESKAKEAEARDDRSETVGHEEQLPQYHQAEEPAHDESDWEKYGSEEEGEYVKISVD